MAYLRCKIRYNENGTKETALIIINGVLSNRLSSEDNSYQNFCSKLKPEYIFNFNSDRIQNTSNAYYKANYLKHRLHQIINSYHLKTLHLIIISPDQFATLFGVMTDMINAEIKLYFLGENRQEYRHSGSITNSIFNYK